MVKYNENMKKKKVNCFKIIVQIFFFSFLFLKSRQAYRLFQRVIINVHPIIYIHIISKYWICLYHMQHLHKCSHGCLTTYCSVTLRNDFGEYYSFILDEVIKIIQVTLMMGQHFFIKINK